MDAASTTAKVSVIVPTLDEADNIDALMGRLIRAFNDAHLTFEVLFADGGSTDGTAQAVGVWEGRAPVHFVHAATGRGLAGDVLAAARLARAQIVLVMDADLSHSPDEAPALVRPVLEGECDMAIGARYLRGGTTPDWPWARRVISRAAGALAWPLTDVHDPTSGFFAVRRDRLLAVDGDAEGFKIALEVLLSNGQDLRVTEVPVCFRDRSHGHSKMNMGQATSYLRRLSALAGGIATATTARRFAFAGLCGCAADVGAFAVGWSLGLGLSLSHIVSFLLATTAVYAMCRRWVFPASACGPRNGESIRLATMFLMGLFLRAGILAMLTQREGWPALPAVAVAALAITVMTYPAYAFFVFRCKRARSPVLSWRLAAVALIGYTVLLRLVYLGLPDLLPEEAYYWNYAQHPDWGYLDHPPAVAWLIGSGTAVFGDTEFGVRIGTFLCWFATAGFSFGLARNLFDKATAMAAVTLAAVLPFFFLFGFFATPDAPLTTCWAGALYFFERALLAERRQAWWGVGVCMGLGMLSKYTIALLAPAAMVFLLSNRSSRRWLLRPQPYVAAMIAMLLFTPVLLWNLEHDWASFAFQGSRRLAGEPRFGLGTLLISILALITPIGAVGALQAIMSGGTCREGTGRIDSQMLQRQLFPIVFTIVPLSIFVLFSLRREPKPNWTGPIWLAMLPALAHQAMAIPRAWKAEPSPRPSTLMPRSQAASHIRDALGRWRLPARLETLVHDLWLPTLGVVVLLFGAALHYLTIGLPGLGIGQGMHMPVAWEEIGRDVERMENLLEASVGEQPLVVGMDKYFMASELAFYRRDGRESVEQTTSRHLFGGSAVMYEFWFPRQRQTGRVLLLVSLEREDVEDRAVAAWVDRADPIDERVITKDGRSVRYFCRTAYDYHAHSPGIFPRLANSGGNS